MKIGYARCSTVDQNLDWQIDALNRQGCERIFQEKITGTKKERPELIRMMDTLREGDTIIICELTRLSRSVRDLFELVEQIEKAGVSQFERDLTHQRTMEGIASARARDRMGGRPSKDRKVIEQALTLYDSMEYPVSEITKTTGISRRTLYKYINLRKEKQASGK